VAITTVCIASFEMAKWLPALLEQFISVSTIMDILSAVIFSRAVALIARSS
jgi:hypothetical protein